MTAELLKARIPAPSVPMVTLPRQLIEAVRNQRAILFLGAGASAGAKHPQEQPFLNGEALKIRLCDKFLGGDCKSLALTEVADFAINEVGLPQVQLFIRSLFVDYKPPIYHKIIPKFHWQAIATTNYDLIIERAYQQDGALQQLVPILRDEEPFDQMVREPLNGLPFLKLHGCIDTISDAQIPLILSSEQYENHLLHRKNLFSRLALWGAEYSFIFCGHSLGDPHIRRLIYDSPSAVAGRPQYFLISPDITPHHANYWGQKRVITVQTTLEGLMHTLLEAIPENARAIPLDIGGGSLSLRSHYRISNAPESNLLKSFLQHDVEHVRAGMPIAEQQPAEFYHGNDTGWGAVEQKLDVYRKVEDNILVDGVLNTSQPEKHVSLYWISGPAGNGKSVVLKRVAWEASLTYEKIVLYARPNGALRNEAIEEIYALTGKRIYLFVDHAALFRDQLASLILFARNKSIPLSVYAAERDNEWHTYCSHLTRFLQCEYPVRYMSEKEIEELLNLLEKHHALGALKPMSYSERVEFFVKRAARQILVALHEATLGKSFEELVFDEYERIIPDEAKRLYLDICTLHQLDVPVRATTIAKITGVTFTDFKNKLITPLKNVIFVREDRYGKDHLYVARHAHVAEMVFNRVLTSQEERHDQLIRIMEGLDLGYSNDIEAFQRLTKGRAISDIFSSAEIARRVYDVAESINPENPYLLQQRAIFEMKHKHGSLDQARKLAEIAHNIKPDSKTIVHTQAEVARKLANEAEDPLQRESWRKQAEKYLGKGEVNERYGASTAIRLCIDRLRDVLNSARKQDDNIFDESIMELNKEADSLLARAIQQYPDTSLFRECEADLATLLQENKRGLKALEKAYKINPRQDWLAVRLSRAYWLHNQEDDAIKVLHNTLSLNPNNFNCHLEIAKRYQEKGNIDKEVILDHLRRSFMTNDGRFEARFRYACELYLSGDFSRSTNLFKEIDDKAPEDFKQFPTGRVSNADGNYLRYQGRITSKEEAYTFIKWAKAPQDLFASFRNTNEKHWDALSKGMEASFVIAFNRKGPLALDLRPI